MLAVIYCGAVGHHLNVFAGLALGLVVELRRSERCDTRNRLLFTDSLGLVVELRRSERCDTRNRLLFTDSLDHSTCSGSRSGMDHGTVCVVWWWWWCFWTCSGTLPLRAMRYTEPFTVYRFTRTCSGTPPLGAMRYTEPQLFTDSLGLVGTRCSVSARGCDSRNRLLFTDSLGLVWNRRSRCVTEPTVYRFTRTCSGTLPLGAMRCTEPFTVYRFTRTCSGTPPLGAMRCTEPFTVYRFTRTCSGTLPLRAMRYTEPFTVYRFTRTCSGTPPLGAMRSRNRLFTDSLGLVVELRCSE
ncbi:hypothetical protein J6590_066835 [Homalodisca vitripennis]|nr:hypothetical protein J6590_066835 [Homalodisca vitripennis]